VAGDAPGLADMLVRAFDDDPVADFMFAGPRRRRRGLHAFFASQLRLYLSDGHVAVSVAGDGAALWGPPERVRHGVRELVQLLPAGPFLISHRAHRALRLLFEVDGLHPAEPHWYLATLGVEPGRQGHGVGTLLLRSMLGEIDRTGMPAYLESSKERNVGFYARFGFTVVEELRSASGGPPIWRMWREPQVPSI
jgi:GNAT superfamily N-acetyltransferase